MFSGVFQIQTSPLPLYRLPKTVKRPGGFHRRVHTERIPATGITVLGFGRASRITNIALVSTA